MEYTPALTEPRIARIFSAFGRYIRCAGCDNSVVLAGELIPHRSQTCAAVETVEKVLPAEFGVVLDLADQGRVEFFFVD
jgi:hypothetical protein